MKDLEVKHTDAEDNQGNGPRAGRQNAANAVNGVARNSPAANGFGRSSNAVNGFSRSSGAVNGFGRSVNGVGRSGVLAGYANGYHMGAHYTPPSQPQPGRYYGEAGAQPPPAHFAQQQQHPVAGSEAPPGQPRLPQASNAPLQAESLLMLLQRYPVIWQGLLALKNDHAAVQMHFVWGNPSIARESLPCNSDGSTPPLRISQRMQLEAAQLEGVVRKMQIDQEHCILLALPCGRDHIDVLQQSENLQDCFIAYLNQKRAAGIVNIAVPGTAQPAYVVHIFPLCPFATENLARTAPDLLRRVSDIAHLLIIVTTV